MGERIKKLKKIRIHREGTHELTISAIAVAAIGALLWYGLDTKIPFIIFVLIFGTAWMMALNFYRCPIVRIDLPKDNQVIANYSITVKTDDLEIEYFGYMKINPELAVGDRIEKGTYLATMLGGGDSGMVLNIRMRYKGDVIDPTPFFPSYDNE